MQDDVKVKGGMICGGITVVVTILLVALSFDTVEPTEWGLK